MLKRKHLMMCLLVFCLTATLFIGVASNPSTASTQPYDPWKDIDDNGVINILDILGLAVMFGKEGTPINKTALLLDLQERVVALETRIPRKGYVSVPAAAFVPLYSNTSIMNTKIDTQLYNYGDSSAWFVAPVHLPHGVIITNVTWYFYDGGADQIDLVFGLYNQTIGGQHTVLLIAHHDTQGAPGYGIVYDDTISFATVDNTQWAYILSVALPPSATHDDYRLQFAVIEYEYPA